MAKKSIYTKELGTVVARDAKGTTAGIYHIVSAPADKWAIVPKGAVRPLKAFATQKAAVSFAKRYAADKPVTEVVIHERNGSIQHRIAI